MVNMSHMPQREQRVDVQKISHGKSASNARTCSLVTRGAPLGPVLTIMPVILDLTNRGRAVFGFRPALVTDDLVPASARSRSASASFWRLVILAMALATAVVTPFTLPNPPPSSSREMAPTTLHSCVSVPSVVNLALFLRFLCFLLPQAPGRAPAFGHPCACGFGAGTPACRPSPRGALRVAKLLSTMPSRPLPLIDTQELARRNNESSAAARKPRRTKSKLLNKALGKLALPTRPIRAVGFFYPERKVGLHDTHP